MKPFFVVVFALLMFSFATDAQVVLQGKVEYQRKLNLHRQFDDFMNDENGEYIKAWIAKIPKFDTRTFLLYFNTRKTKYEPVLQEEDPMLRMMGGMPGAENEVVNDMQAHEVTAYKQVYEESFLLKDSMKRLIWKIMDEVRVIAGYNCRKAVSRINDSVVVVAFYTDKIPVSAGPELFSGLPGMILEIAIPRLYTTWIAKSVILESIPEEKMLVSKKAKKTTTMKDLEVLLQSRTKDWGKYGARNIWWSTL